MKFKSFIQLMYPGATAGGAIESEPPRLIPD